MWSLAFICCGFTFFLINDCGFTFMENIKIRCGDPIFCTFSFLIFRLVSVGNLEAAVSLLLSTPPESSYFYANALRAVALSSAVSRSLLELAVKVSILCICPPSKDMVIGTKMVYFPTLFTSSPYSQLGCCSQHGQDRSVTFWYSSSLCCGKVSGSLFSG